MKLTLDNLHHYATEEGDCLLWNLGCNGDGNPIARVDCKCVKVRRYVFETLLGKPVHKNKRVTTKCCNPLCISPKCLRAMTYGEINRKTIKAGRRIVDSESMRRAVIKSGQAKLHEHVQAIRLSDEPSLVLAQRYGVNPSTIRDVRFGRTWGSDSWVR